MTLPLAEWPYLPTLVRLALALAIGLFVGVERERREKDSGLWTFGFATLLGSLGGLLGRVDEFEVLPTKSTTYGKIGVSINSSKINGLVLIRQHALVLCHS